MNIGDIVELKSGSMAMTIVKINTGGDGETYANVVYESFGKLYTDNSNTLNIKVLKPYTKQDDKKE